VPQSRLDAEDFREQPVAVCGKAFVAHLSGGLYWPAEDALIVADLHLEPRTGGGSPHETLTRLAETIDRTGASTVIALGSPVAELNEDAMAEAEREALRVLQEEADWIWVAGSGSATVAQQFGGHGVDTLTVSGLTLRHQPATGRVTHEIAGWMHPAARVSRLGHTIHRPCFVGNGNRLILPSFGAPSGGRNILDEAFDPLFGADGMQVWVLGHEGLYPVAPRLLRAE
jgi:uncharacterized protein